MNASRKIHLNEIQSPHLLPSWESLAAPATHITWCGVGCFTELAKWKAHYEMLCQWRCLRWTFYWGAPGLFKSSACQLDGKPHQSNQAIPQRSFCRLDMQLWKPHATSPTPTPSTWARLNCQPTGDSKAVCVSCKSWCLMHHCEAFHASPQNSSNVLEAALKSRCLISKAAFLSSRFCLRAWSPCWMKFSKSSAGYSPAVDSTLPLERTSLQGTDLPVTTLYCE